MPKTKVTSPARSQGGTTPKRKTTRSSRSLCSPALSTASGRLTSLIDQFKDKNMESFALSPLNGRSVLNDNTEIEEPRRKSWWKKLDENSQDVMEVLEDNKLTDVNNIIEEFIDIEVLSQERKNFTLDLPESSDNESINSIVLPQRKLFTQKENQPQKKYGHLIDNRESLAKLHKTNTTNIDKTINVGKRELFQNTKRSKPIFPAALLNISPNNTAADKTKENVLLEPKPQVRNIFGNRPASKRKNMFTDFIVSESEDEIPDIQPRVFGFQRKIEQRRFSSISKGRDASPSSSITTDIEMDFGMLLPSSTMVENQLEDNMLPSTPIKRARLSKLSEAKESEVGTNTIQTNSTADKTKQSNKSVSSKNKSKASPELRDKSLNSSRTTRSMLKNASKLEENVNTSLRQDLKSNKSLSAISPKENTLNVSTSKSDTDKKNATLNKSQKQNKSKARSSSKAVENNKESEGDADNVENALNNLTRVINKSTNKSLLNTTATNKSVNEKERTVTMKVHKTDSNDVEQNEQEEDENNFSLQYENDDNDNIEEAEVHNDLYKNQKDVKNLNSVVLENELQKNAMNKSKNNKSIVTSKSMQKEPKPTKTVEESVESQTEQYSADDNVDGNVEQGQKIIDEEINENINNSHKVINEKMEQEDETKMDIGQENDEANDGENNEDKENVSQENEDERNESQEEVANVSQEAENEEIELEEEGDKNEDQANESQEVGAEVNDSQDIEEEANQSQEVDEEANESQEVDEEANESQEINEEAHVSQEIDEEANESQEVDEEANESQEIDEEAHVSQEIDEEANENQEIDEEANKSQEMDAEANESQEIDEEANESQEIDEEANESQEIDEEANESQEIDEKANESQEIDEEVIESQEIDEKANESQEIDEEANKSQEIEGDTNESQIIANNDASNEADEETDEEEAANESEVNEASDIENDEEESEFEANQSEEIEDDQQMENSDEADKAIASDPEISDTDDNQADEMEVDDDEDESENAHESEQNQDESHEERQNEEQNEVQPSSEEIEESPNVTHDTTGRHRKKDFNKSPEVILHDKTNQMDSFTAEGRNTSVRKTKSMIKNLNLRPSLAPPRNSTGFSDGTTNSSAEGSGWDSHRTTRKTLRQTFGKDFTPRKSLRALVMEKSAKRQTEQIAMHSETVKYPLANSTEMPEDTYHYVDDIEESDHEVSRRTRQTTLEKYLQKIKEQNIEKKLKMEQAVRNSLKGPVGDPLSLFKVPNKPAPRRPKPAQSKAKKQSKSIVPFDELPSEVIEDMKYKPPKRFQPTNASWITKRLYKFLENKLEPKYDYKARVRAEKLVETIYHFAKDLRRHDAAPSDSVEVLKHELARLEVVRTHFEFYEFFHEFMPREIRVKVVPDIVNKISLPRHGVFSDILRGNTVQG